MPHRTLDIESMSISSKKSLLSVAFVFATIVGCSPPTPVVRTAGAEDIKMSEQDAALVDQLRASEPPAGGAADFRACHYWLDAEQKPEVSAPVHHYVEAAGNAACKSARSWGLDPTKLKASGDFSAELSLEKSGEAFAAISIVLKRKGTPAAGTPITLMTAPEFEGHRKHAAAVSDLGGVARLDAADAKAQLFGDYFPGAKPGSYRMPTFIIVVDDQRIPVGDQIRPIYFAWIEDAEGGKKQSSADDDATADQEIKTGRCEQSRAANMQNVATSLGRFFSDALSDGNDTFTVIDKKIVVATKDGTAVPIDAKLGGDEHLFVFGFEAVTLDLVDSTSYPVTAHSPYETPVKSASGGNIDSRNFHANPREQLSAKIHGSGCALVLLVKKT